MFQNKIRRKKCQRLAWSSVYSHLKDQTFSKDAIKYSCNTGCMSLYFLIRAAKYK